MESDGLCEARIDLADRSTWYTTTPTARSINLPFYLLEWGHFVAGREYYTVRNNNRFLLFHTLSGRGSLIYGGKTYSLEPGTVAVIWCGARHEYRTHGESHWEFQWFHYHGVMAHEYFRMMGGQGPAVFRIEPHNRATGLIGQLTGTTSIAGLSQGMEIALLLTELMTLLGQCAQGQSTTIPREMVEKMDRAILHMEENLHKKLTVEGIAATVFLSKFHFIRVFHKVMGTSPYGYLTNLRVNRAKELLILSDHSLTEIAEQVGFCDSKNLIRNFKKAAGQTPQQYRKANYGFGTREDVKQVTSRG